MTTNTFKISLLAGAIYVSAVVWGFSILQWNQTGPGGF
jgi:hypothetical protein